MFVIVPHGNIEQLVQWVARLQGTKMESWDKQMLREFSIYKYVMSPVGTWPVQPNKSLANFKVSIVTFLQTTMIITLAADHVGSGLGNIDVAIDRFGLMVSSSLAMSKVLLLRWHQNHLTRIVQVAGEDWSAKLLHHYRRTMLDYADLSRSIFFYQMIFSYFVVVTLVLPPLMLPDMVYAKNESLQESSYTANRSVFIENGSLYAENETTTYMKFLPLGTTCLYPEGNDLICNALYALQTIQLTSTCTGNLGTDVFLYGVAFHLCGQFEILANDMLVFGKTESVAEERGKITTNVDRHQLLLDLADKLEVVARHILLIQIFLNGLHICLVGFQLIGNIRARNFAMLLRSIVVFSVIMVQLYLYCYMGESLSTRTEKIIDAVYLSDWYNLPARTIKDLSFVIARAAVPFRITAGSFYHMNLNSFKNIVKASVSYISVLQLIFEE